METEHRERVPFRLFDGSSLRHRLWRAHRSLSKAVLCLKRGDTWKRAALHIGLPLVATAVAFGFIRCITAGYYQRTTPASAIGYTIACTLCCGLAAFTTYLWYLQPPSQNEQRSNRRVSITLACMTSFAAGGIIGLLSIPYA